ncbi:hypothetical protein [Fluviispira vulneris]|uniref:hypothetical protein n=1 Tax=Fluviispira vulneris TaxID=2763012 RepID=UPI00164696A7|nr:hypothetical protein [Fluviispira vulneris]
MKSAKFLLPLLVCVSCSKHEEKKPESKLNEVIAKSSFTCVDTDNSGLFNDCRYSVKDIENEYFTAKINFLPAQTEISSLKLSDFVKKKSVEIIEKLSEENKLSADELKAVKSLSENIITQLQSIFEKYKFILQPNRLKYEFLLDQDLIDTFKASKSNFENALKYFKKGTEKYKTLKNIIESYDELITELEKIPGSELNKYHDFKDLLMKMNKQENIELIDMLKDFEKSNITINKDTVGNINVNFYSYGAINTEKFTFKLENGERVYKLD